MSVCKVFDPEYIESNPYWVVTLSNGETIYSDSETPDAWLRLGKYCKENSLYIISMSFGFRSNTRTLPFNSDGYFFCKSASCTLGNSGTQQMFVVGTLRNGTLETQYWKVPEMLFQNTEIRKIEKCGECLIQKNMPPFMEQ